MKTIIALAATAIALAVGAGTASPATPVDRKIAALQKQTAALQKRVTTLEKNLTAARNVAVAALVYAQCFTAATADAFAGTWNVVDQIAQATQAGKVYFGPQAAVNDFQSCQSAQITRQQTVPPNVSVFSALTALIGA
jgi:hypothetical protein